MKLLELENCNHSLKEQHHDLSSQLKSVSTEYATLKENYDTTKTDLETSKAALNHQVSKLNIFFLILLAKSHYFKFGCIVSSERGFSSQNEGELFGFRGQVSICSRS